MYKRKVYFTNKDLPPKFLIKGQTLLMLDPKSRRWCLIGRAFRKRELVYRRYLAKQQVYQHGFATVYRSHH